MHRSRFGSKPAAIDFRGKAERIVAFGDAEGAAEGSGEGQTVAMVQAPRGVAGMMRKTAYARYVGHVRQSEIA
jgi:hypothetical protein